MAKQITVTEMIRTFSDIIGQVYYQGEEFNIKKGRNIVATISPPTSSIKRPETLRLKDMREFFANCPKLEKEDIGDFEQSISELRALKNRKSLNKWD